MGKRRRSKHQEAARSRQNPAWVDITKENALLETYYQVCAWGRNVILLFLSLTAVSVENGPFWQQNITQSIKVFKTRSIFFHEINSLVIFFLHDKKLAQASYL